MISAWIDPYLFMESLALCQECEEPLNYDSYSQIECLQCGISFEIPYDIDAYEEALI